MNDRKREIRKQIAALENERDANGLIESLVYLAGHIAVLADASFEATERTAKEGLAIMARNLAESLAARLDSLAAAKEVAA